MTAGDAKFSRYGLYYLPGGAFGAVGAGWLGWDAAAGRTVAQDDGLATATATPRKYGFHATLKPPFQPTADEAALRDETAGLAARMAPASARRLRVAPLGRFLALVPDAPHDLGRIARACVEALDPFRAPAPPEETARRRAAGLTGRQEAMLARWGYPYVMEEFRFHITLSGPLDDAGSLTDRARDHFADVLPEPFVLDAVALVGEGTDGRFRLVERFALEGG